MCSCNQGKTTAYQFKVIKGDGSTTTVPSEQEARSLVRMSGGSYTKVEKK